MIVVNLFCLGIKLIKLSPEIRELCLNADDIWLFFQEKLSNIEVVGGKSYKIPLMILNSQNVRLMNDNVFNNGNRDYFCKMKKYYNLDLI